MLEMPAKLEAGFDPWRRIPKGIFSRTIEGNPLARAVLNEGWESTLRFPIVPWAFIRDTWRPAWKKHLRGTPFVLAWNRTLYPDDLHLISASGDYKAPLRQGTITDLSFPVTGLAIG